MYGQEPQPQPDLTQKIEPWMSPELIKIRQNGSRYLEALITDEGVLENIDDLSDLYPNNVTVLGGGESSVCYFLNNNGDPTVLKLRTSGIDAEVETLQAWEKQGVKVPHVKASGVVPLPPEEMDVVKYIVLEGIVDTNGKPASNGFEFIERQSSDIDLQLPLIKRIGINLGEQLAKMHQAISDGSFGELSNTRENPIKTYLKYIHQVINYSRGYRYNTQTQEIIKDEQNDHLSKIGLSDEEIEILLHKIKNISFPEKGSYILETLDFIMY